MENNLGKITQVLILIAIMPYSIGKCVEYRISSFYYNCWMRNDKEYCYNFRGSYPLMECPDLNFTMVAEQSKTSARIMRLHQKHLIEIESKSFGEFTELLLLDMSECYIQTIQAGAFHGLSKLELLDLRRNEITALSEEIFGDLANLKILLLADNKIDQIWANTFRRNVNLQELYVSNNEISDMSPIMSSCKSLTHLDISNNKLTKLNLMNNTELAYLNIASNSIENLSKDSFGNNSLIYLDVFNNTLQHISSDILENLRGLEKLNVSHNPLFKTDALPTGFFQYSEGLEVLNLSSTSLRTINVGSFSALRNLVVLDLSKNELTHIPAGTLHTLQRLRRLYVNSNRLSYLGDLTSFYLSEIDLNDNLWNCDILSSLLHTFRYVRVLRGNSYNTTNVHGIKCHEVIKHESDILNPKILQQKYLLHLVDGAKEMTETLKSLKNFLNATDSDESFYSTKYLRNTLFVTDFALYAIFICGVIIFTALVYVYYKKNNHLIEY